MQETIITLIFLLKPRFISLVLASTKQKVTLFLKPCIGNGSLMPLYDEEWGVTQGF